MLKERKTVHWFDSVEEPRHYRMLRWVGAVFCALLFNFAYFVAMPGVAQVGHAEGLRPAEPEAFELMLLEAEEDPRYVETNPEAPENEPDRTPQFSDRDQQAAQEDQRSEHASPTPYVEGEEPESQKIKEGFMPSEPDSSHPMVAVLEGSQGSQGQPGSPESAPSMDMPSFEGLPSMAPPPPTPDFIDELDSEDPDGVDIPIIRKESEDPDLKSEREVDTQTLNVNIPPSVAQLLSEFQQHQPERPSTDGGETSRPQPMPRPRLSPDVLPGPLMDARTFAVQMGITAIDAQFSQFGFYLKRMFDTIQLQWYSLLANVTIGQENRPARVDIEFTLASDGRVMQADVLDTNAGQLATLLCKDAIESRSPFGPWTEQMVDSMGTETTIRVRFIYY